MVLTRSPTVTILILFNGGFNLGAQTPVLKYTREALQLKQRCASVKCSLLPYQTLRTHPPHPCMVLHLLSAKYCCALTPLNPRSPRSRAIADPVCTVPCAAADPAQSQIPRSPRSSPSCATPSCDRCHAEHHPGQRSAARRRCDSWGGADSAGHQCDRQDGAAAMECAVARRVLVHGGRASLCGCGSSTAAWCPLLSSRSYGGASEVCAAAQLGLPRRHAKLCGGRRRLRASVLSLRHSRGSLWVGRRSGVCNCPGICSGRVQCRWRELGCT
jgi:hypothetical protein